MVEQALRRHQADSAGTEEMGQGQRERDRLAFFDFEIGPGFEVLAAEFGGSA
jgi:hypothetical protein